MSTRSTRVSSIAEPICDNQEAGLAEPQVRRISGIVVSLIAIGLLSLLVAGLYAVSTLREGEERYEQIKRTREVEALIASIGIQVERSEAARRGYLLHRDQWFRGNWHLAGQMLSQELPRLEELLEEDERQQERARALRAMVADLREIGERSMALVDAGGAEAARTDFANDRSVTLLRAIREHRLDMAGIEERLVQQRDESRREALASFYPILGLCAFLVLAIVGTSILVIRRYTNALAASRRVLQHLNTDLESAVRERTGELQRANEEIQRFAYIVSHDLRSPLVNVMGFTSELETARQPLAKLIAAAEEKAPDLVTQEARLAIDEDLPEAIRFIRSSTEKMDRLINAILKLSREGRRTLVPEPLAMAELVSKAADALRHRAAALGVEVEVEPLPDIVADRVAIEQIFSNLLENAIKYLKEDRPGRITVSGRSQGARLIYEIADNGRGIDPKDHDRIFDLFRRSGAQDQPGEGIGLAHVRSLVWRLGGSVELQSALDEGTTFRLSLPPRPIGEDSE
jgi:signal transduction histidine kinase